MEQVINHIVREKQPNEVDMSKVPVVKTAFPNNMPWWPKEGFIPSTHPEA